MLKDVYIKYGASQIHLQIGFPSDSHSPFDPPLHSRTEHLLVARRVCGTWLDDIKLCSSQLTKLEDFFFSKVQLMTGPMRRRDEVAQKKRNSLSTSKLWYIRASTEYSLGTKL